MPSQPTALIFDIQGYSVHDGSGCRTLVFLSGCPLRCAWCANPEGLLPRPRLMYRAQKCAPTYYRCIQACPQDAIQTNPTSDPPLIFDRSLCDRCDSMDCVPACLNQALEVAGREYTLNALMRLLHRDQDYWGEGGGVTFGGGEPLMQADFLLAALERCRSNYIHTAVETSAHAPTEILIQALRLADWVFFDLKHCDSAAHRDGTGVGNELILQNLEVVAAARADCRLIVRVPIVPLFNDAPENLRATADLMRKLDLKEVNLLPFHRLASSKYQQLGLDYAYAHVPPPSKAMMLSHQSIFTQAGLLCYLGANTPF